jgi:hypothetical protein
MMTRKAGRLGVPTRGSAEAMIHPGGRTLDHGSVRESGLEAVIVEAVRTPIRRGHPENPALTVSNTVSGRPSHHGSCGDPGPMKPRRRWPGPRFREESAQSLLPSLHGPLEKIREPLPRCVTARGNVRGGNTVSGRGVLAEYATGHRLAINLIRPS